jgi:hypothetical protein
MRAQLVERLAAAPENLEPLARQAAAILRDRAVSCEADQA